VLACLHLLGQQSQLEAAALRGLGPLPIVTNNLDTT